MAKNMNKINKVLFTSKLTQPLCFTELTSRMMKVNQFWFFKHHKL